MKVAFSMRIVRAPDHGEIRDAISHDWLDWAGRFDALPLLVPNGIPALDRFLDASAPDLLILTGGNDAVEGGVGRDYEPLRNASEEAMLAYAVERRVPVLAVCRGMHMLNLHFGGAVIPVLPDEGRGHVRTTHAVRLAEPFSVPLGAARITTNSFHRQGVRPTDVAPGLMPFAFSERDGVVEALAHRNLPMIGIQWHPERANPAAAVDAAIVDMLRSPRPFWMSAA